MRWTTSGAAAAALEPLVGAEARVRGESLKERLAASDMRNITYTAPQHDVRVDYCSEHLPKQLQTLRTSHSAATSQNRTEIVET